MIGRKWDKIEHLMIGRRRDRKRSPNGDAAKAGQYSGVNAPKSQPTWIIVIKFKVLSLLR